VTRFRLVIGNKNYSSWSLRGYLMLSHTGAVFEEILLQFETPEFARVREYSPAARVPVLLDGDLAIWDTLAIAEYLAEQFPAAGLWPRDPAQRARARSISAEMHSGFSALRNAMPMNLRARRPGAGHTAEALADAQRIMNIWRNCRADAETGEFLFGAYSIADAMFTPVATRFQTYGVAMDPISQRYASSVLAVPAMQRWHQAALAEPWILPAEEVGA
jgi:glutathione S-transferase